MVFSHQTQIIECQNSCQTDDSLHYYYNLLIKVINLSDTPILELLLAYISPSTVLYVVDEKNTE
jgi:hypothetical protein